MQHPGSSAIDYRLLVEGVRDYAILTLDPRGDILSWNQGAQLIIGHEPAAVVGRHCSCLNVAEDLALGKPSQLLVTAAAQGHCEDEGWRVRHDGSRFWANVILTALYDDQHTLLGFSMILRDLSARRLAEAFVKDSESRLSAIVNTAVDGIITIDQHGVIESCNPATERLFGYSMREMIGQNVRMLMPSPFREQHDAYLEHYLHTGERKIIGIGREVMGRRKDGTTFPMDLAVSELYIGGKRMFTGLVHDVTDRKRAEHERDRLLESERAARAEAERANRAKDDFLAALSHELRTPLTPVLLSVSLIGQDPELSPALREDIELIRRNVVLEARLIDDLLDLTRVVRGKMMLTPETTDIHHLIQRAADTCDHKGGIDLVFELQAKAHHIHADPARMQQVFWNLLSNAHKFTPIGGTIFVRTSNPRSGMVRVEVTDTGRGIDAELLPKIFNAFEQGDSNTARRFGGLGLGLAICRAITAAHQATLTAESAGKAKGSSFFVEIPTVPAPAPSAPGLKASPSQTTRRLRILLVEDHAPTLNILSQALRRIGHEIHAAGNVEGARQIASSQPLDLLISDLGLPDGSGYDVMQHVARLGTKGIALSGYGMTEDIRKSFEAGFARHLTKPVDLERLLAVMGEVSSGE